MALLVKKLPANAEELRDKGSVPGSGRYHGEGHGNHAMWYIYTMDYYSAIKNNLFESVLMRWMKLEPTPVFLPGEFHGQRSLASYSP